MDCDEIAAEVKKQPFISEMKEISVEEYEEGSVFATKLRVLSMTHPRLRHIRRDGNCFYRCVLMALVDETVENEAKRRKLVETARKFFDVMIGEFGMSEMIVEDFRDALVDTIGRYAVGIDAIVRDLNEEYGPCDSAVAFLRLILSVYIQQNAGFFEPLVAATSPSSTTLKQFCAVDVEPMYKDVDQLHLIAFARAINIRIIVYYIDQSNANNDDVPGKCTTYDFRGDGEAEDFTVSLLYRPGHYDILYKT
jgi:ubiquitin thioesterase protein OTUB1